VIEDTVAPVITLNGANPVNLIYNDTVTPTFFQPYVEFGATSDGGEVVTIDSSAVNETTAGTYTVYYSATDRVGNIGTTTRTVIVTLDADAPTVTLNNPSYNPVDLVFNSTNDYSETYTEYGATATDTIDGTLSVVKTVTRNGTSVSDVDPIVAGTYTVRYTATDTAGNEGFVTRTVTVVEDTVAPVVTLNGDTLIKIVQNYSGSLGIPSPPVTVSAPDQNLPVVITDPNSRSVIGTYYIVYTVTDRALNVGSVSRQVNVYSTTTAPSFSLIGGNQTITECNSYTDPGYQNVDFEISNTPTYSTNLNTSLPGTYTASWTSTSPLLGSTQTTTLSRTVTVNAISFTPASTSNVAYSYYEPIIDNSGYTNYSLRISDVTNSNFSHPNGTITEINRRYLPACNTQIRASRYLFRQKVDPRFSIAAANIGRSLVTTFNGGNLGGVNDGTVVLYHTFTYGSTSGSLLRLGDLDVYSYNGGTRIRFEWSNSVSTLARFRDVYIPGNTPTNQKMIFSVSGQMDRDYDPSDAFPYSTSYRCTYSVTHTYKIRIRVYTYNGSSSLTSAELQTGNENDCGVIGGAFMSASTTTSGFATGTTAAAAEAAAQAAAAAIDYRLFRTSSSYSPLINIQVLTGSNSDAWNLSDSGTSTACVFTRGYNGNFE
jgi:hypothetical protein